MEEDCPIAEGAENFLWRVFAVACGVVNELEFLRFFTTTAEVEQAMVSLQRSLKTFSHFSNTFNYIPIGSRIEAYASSDRIIQKEAMENGITAVNLSHIYSHSSKTFYLNPEPTNQDLVSLLDKLLAFTFVCPRFLITDETTPLD